MKPVNLNQLLFHSHSLTTLSFYQPHEANLEKLESFVQDMQVQLSLRDKSSLAKILRKHKTSITKIINAHPDQSIGFFFSEELQGYIVLETHVEAYSMIGNSFHVRPLLEELFVNPDYLVVNVSLYDINVYRGDFHHLEIIQHYEFAKLAVDMKSRVFAPNNVGLIPYKSILALKTIAQKVIDLTAYDSIPVIVTGELQMRALFLKYFTNQTGIITSIDEDFYEKTCVEILERCKNFRHSVMDFYSYLFKERLKKMVKSKRLISDLGLIIDAARKGNIAHLVLPIEKKVYGKIDFETGAFELHKRTQRKKHSVDILNELADEVMSQGGRIQILGPHFFPQDTHVLAILRG